MSPRFCRCAGPGSALPSPTPGWRPPAPASRPCPTPCASRGTPATQPEESPMSSPMPEAEQEWSATPFENPDAYIRLLRLMEVRSQIDVLAFEAKALTMELEAIIPKTALFVDPAGIPWRGTVVRPDDTIDVDLAALESRWP